MVVALPTGVWFWALTLRGFAEDVQVAKWARQLFIASLLYLPILMFGLGFDRLMAVCWPNAEHDPRATCPWARVSGTPAPIMATIPVFELTAAGGALSNPTNSSVSPTSRAFSSPAATPYALRSWAGSEARSQRRIKRACRSERSASPLTQTTTRRAQLPTREGEDRRQRVDTPHRLR